MAGGCGTEWYFGYDHPHSDLTCQSWRSRDLFWDQCKIALDFFNHNEIPISEIPNFKTSPVDHSNIVHLVNPLAPIVEAVSICYMFEYGI